MTASEKRAAWTTALAHLQEALGEACVQSWFADVCPQNTEGGVVWLQTAQRLVRDRLSTQYAATLLKACQKAWPGARSVEIVLVDRALEMGFATDSAAEAAPVRPPEAVVSNASKNPPAPDFMEGLQFLDPRFILENFVVGKPNEFAYAAGMRVAESETAQFNPLFLYGGVGLGKTHLMHGIAWKIREQQPTRRVIYLSAEKFMYQFLRALRFRDTMAFKEQFRSVDVLMIDDFQFIGGKESTQEEFFHTFNALVDSRRQVVIAADKSPSDLENVGERLKSRLGWGLVADIHPTTYELRLGILQAKAEKLTVAVPKGVLEFLSAKVTSNVRELEGALNRIVAHASLVGRDITLESTQEVLRDVLRFNARYITIEDIQRRTSEFFGVKVSDLLSARRIQSLAKPRQVAMFLCKQLTSYSLPEIGRKFGGRDHTTVMHAVKKITELCAIDPAFARDVEVVRASLALNS